MKAGFYAASVLFASGFIGSAALGIDLGSFSLFPFRILLILLLGLLLGSCLLAGFDMRRVTGIRWYLLFLACWCVFGTASLGWAVSQTSAIRHLLFVASGSLTVALVCYYCSTTAQVKRLNAIWLLMFSILLLVGLWEHLTGQHLPVSAFYNETRGRLMSMPTGFFHNPNDYATVLALSVPFAIGLVRYGRRALAKAVGTCMIGLAFYLILAAGSRANLIAVLVEFAVLFLVFMTTGRRVRALAAILGAVVVASAVVPGILDTVSSAIGNPLDSIVTQAAAETGSIAVRANLVRNGLNFLVRTWGFGVGAGNAEVWMASRAALDTHGVLNLHNWWLEILVNYGIWIFAGYVLFYGGLIWKLWEKWRSSLTRDDQMMAEGLVLSLLGFAAASISSSSIMALTPQWLLFAFALAFLNCARRKREVAR